MSAAAHVGENPSTDLPTPTLDHCAIAHKRLVVSQKESPASGWGQGARLDGGCVGLRKHRLPGIWLMLG
jgi:hypothetical protein